jgi:2-polyprenyl-3-methyl-5-hydroxy-6-metoxy-1,4-benzoquinol methylase
MCGSGKTKKKFSELNFYQCKSCGLYARYPMPTSEELDEIYKACYKPEHIENQETDQLSPVGLTIKYFEHVVKILGDGTLRNITTFVDYGSGLCELPAYVKTKNENINVVAVEENFEARQAGKTLLAEENIKADLSDIDANSVDLVTMFEVIEHLTTPWADLKEVYEKLSNDGNLIISTPNRLGLNSLLTGSSWREQNKDFHLIMFDKRYLERLLNDCGFESVMFLRFYPVPDGRWYKRIVHRVLQGLGLYGGLFVVATK